MDDKDTTMFVDFETYCATCEHKETKEIADPCNDCLAIPARPNSTKPEFYKEKE